MGYSGGPITNAISPTIGASKATYTSIFDLTVQVISEHDHTTGKGTAIAAGGLASDAVTTIKILNLAVTTGKINDLAVTTGKLDNISVTAGKIAADAVTTTKILDSNVTTNKIADGAITAVKIGNLEVTETKIATGAVTIDKMGPYNATLSDSCGTYTTTSTSLTGVTNLAATIAVNTTRVVCVGLTSDLSGNAASFTTNSAFYDRAKIILYRGTTPLMEQYAPASGVTWAPSMLMVYDFVTAGTYSYTLKAIITTGGTTLSVSYVKLFALEVR